MINSFFRWLENFNLLVPVHHFAKWLDYRLNFKLQKGNIDFSRAGESDGLPLPPAKLIFLVTNHYDIKAYQESGVADALSIKEILGKNGYSLEKMGTILDFGCGCARTVRQFRNLPGTKLFGCDYNPKLIRWCRKFLPFVQFSINGLDQKLSYGEEQFNLIYAISVFTHLPEDSQNFWLEELKRILMPGGLLYISLQGTTRLKVLDEKERERFSAGELVMRYEKCKGSNICGSFHPEKYLRDNWIKKGFKIVDFVPAGAKGSNQDVVLLKKV